MSGNHDSDPTKSDVLIVFGKAPVPGRVKTRLSPPLNSLDAAALYEAFLLDSLDQYKSIGCTIRLYVPSGDESLIPELPEAVTLHEQLGPDLGSRMRGAIEECSRSGFSRMMIIGTDHPSLPSDYIIQGFRSLNDDRSVCLGPSTDGGYYLVGARTPHPRLFSGLSYSHDRVFADAVGRVREQRLQLTVLPEWYDVDSYSELARLVRESRSKGSVPPRTLDELGRLERRYGDLLGLEDSS